MLKIIQLYESGAQSNNVCFMVFHASSNQGSPSFATASCWLDRDLRVSTLMDFARGQLSLPWLKKKKKPTEHVELSTSMLFSH